MVMFDWLKRILGSNKGDESNPFHHQTADNQTAQTDTHPMAAETHARMDAAWAAIGQSDADLLGYIVNPQFSGAPPWPNMRQAFRVVRLPDSLIIASDGLADPAPDQTDADDVSGFGAEVYIELPGLQDLPQAEIMSHWAFGLIESFARNLASWGGINASLDRYGVLSTALPVPAEPAPGWLDDDGNIGVLVGIPVPGRAASVDLPLGPARLVAVTLLHPTELAFVATGGAQARAELVQALDAAGTQHLSVAGRDSVI